MRRASKPTFSVGQPRKPVSLLRQTHGTNRFMSGIRYEDIYELSGILVRDKGWQVRPGCLSEAAAHTRLQAAPPSEHAELLHQLHRPNRAAARSRPLGARCALDTREARGMFRQLHFAGEMVDVLTKYKHETKVDKLDSAAFRRSVFANSFTL